MAKVLFLAHRVPFPPNKGDKIRAFHILEHLAQRHEIWLGAGADDPADLEHLQPAKARYRDAYFAQLGPVRRSANMAVSLVTGAPLSVGRFRHPGLADWIRRVLENERPDVIYVYSSALAQYVTGWTGAKLIVDFVDADAEKWRAYAQTAGAPAKWIYAAEFRRLVRFDAGVLKAAVAGILVSETERQILGRLLPEGASKLHVVPNGVDTEYFKPSGAASDGRTIVMCGTMDYRPNVEGAIWFAREVLPRVRQDVPEAEFVIVGAKPSPQVLALSNLPGVEVTGAVPDVRPYLERAEVVVAPLHIARGIQNKVLEGMAMGRPTVATPQALDGIAATPGRDVLGGDGVEAFAKAVADTLRGRTPPDLGERGRRYVVETHKWAEQLRALDDIIEGSGHSRSG